MKEVIKARLGEKKLLTEDFLKLAWPLLPGGIKSTLATLFYKFCQGMVLRHAESISILPTAQNELSLEDWLPTGKVDEEGFTRSAVDGPIQAIIFEAEDSGYQFAPEWFARNSHYYMRHGPPKVGAPIPLHKKLAPALSAPVLEQCVDFYACLLYTSPSPRDS